MSSLKIGLVASADDESSQLATLLETCGAQLIHNINPENISDKHVEDKALHVWLLSVDDDSWHDAIDHLLDESEIPVYFSEPGTLEKQSHPDFWCNNLMTRLYEITGLEQAPKSEPDRVLPKAAPQIQSEATEASDNDGDQEALEMEPLETDEPDLHTPLGKSLKELELSTVGLPSDIAAELVSELESISPVLREDESATEQSVEADTESEFEIDESESDFALDLSLEIDDDLSFDLEDEPVNLDLNDDNLELTSHDDEQPDSALYQTQALEKSDESEDAIDFDIDLQLDSETEVETEFELALDDMNDDIQVDSEPDQQASGSGVEPADVDASEPEFELSLASTEDESRPPKTGRAQYQIDDLGESVPAEKKTTATDSESPEKDIDGGLSLVSLDNEKPIKGKAAYKIDDGEQIAAKPTAVKPAVSPQPAAQSDSGLSLQAIDDDKQPEWLSPQKKEQTKQSESDSQASSGKPEEVSADADFSNQGEDEFDFSLEQLDILDSDTEVDQDDNPIELDTIARDSDFDDSDNLKVDLSDEMLNESLQSDFSGSDEFLLDPMDATSQDEQLALLDAELDENLSLDEETIRELARGALTEEDGFEIEDDLEEVNKFSAEESLHSFESLTLESDSDSDDDNQRNQVSAQNSDSNAIPIGAGAKDATLEFEIPMLDETAGDVEFEEKIAPKVESRYTNCWIIGASLGGPAAVKRFLNCLPADINASFVIAQHIDENFLPVLAEILTNSSAFNVKVAQGSNDIKPGSVYLAPLKGKLVFLQDGSMLVDRSQKWSGPYSPCINDVIESVSQVYGNRCGAIIFSGMGEDGLSGARKMRKLGGQVWAQSTDTCANPTMPEAVINNGETDYVGSPEQLAEKLVKHLKGSTSLAG